MDAFLADLRYASRRLLQSPGFTLAAAATLALGIGATTTIFTLVNAVLLRPPVGVASPERLVSIYTSDYSGPRYGTSSIPDFEDFRAQSDVFDGVMLFVQRSVAVGPLDAPERAGLELVSENFFTVLGVKPAHGRFFLSEEGRPGAPPSAVIGDALFRRRFNGSPSVIGTTMAVNGRPFTIVGAAPPGFVGVTRPLAQDLWIPLHAGADVGGIGGDLTSRDGRSAHVMARLAQGVSIDAAQSRMDALARQLHAAHPAAWTDLSNQHRRISLLPERTSRIPPQAQTPALGFVALFMATAGVVLLVCCANVASLMLARSASRGREIGVRISLGATRPRLVQQLLTESGLVALLGGALGVLIAVWTITAILTLLPVGAIGVDLSLDGRVLTFAALVSLATGVVFGLAPALRVTRPDIVSTLKSSTVTIDLGGRRLTLQNVLVVSQVAMSVILLVGAVLFARALQRVGNVDPGFGVENLLVASVGPRPGVQHRDDPGLMMAEIQRRVTSLPGVRSVTWSGALPLDLGGSARRSTTVQGYTPREGEDMEFYAYSVGPRYFETMEIPLARGRDFTTADRQGSAGVIVVNEAFARRFWPDGDALGKRISLRGPAGPFLDIVGVARDARFLSLTADSPPTFFVPALQGPAGTHLLVRATGDPLAVLPAVRREVESVDPAWTVANAQAMEQHIAAFVLPQRIAGRVLGIFGFVAVVLVTVGVYGVLAYSVATRTREIGVRIALGARPRDARWFVVGQGAKLIGIGVLIALPIAAGLMRLLGGFLVGVSASDPIAFAAAVAVLGAVALVATWVPARRASLVDPMVALREE